MKTPFYRNILFIFLVAPLGLHASQAPRPTPTIDFSAQSMRELVQYARNNNVEALTPRSHQSYTDRFKALINQRLNDLRAQLGITPEMVAQNEQQPAMHVILIIPAAVAGPNSAHVGGHSPDCICDLLNQIMSKRGAADTTDHEDMTTEAAAENEEPTTEELNSYLQGMSFKKEQQ